MIKILTLNFAGDYERRKNNSNRALKILPLICCFLIASCSPSKETKEETETPAEDIEAASSIIEAAKAEQQNTMYSKSQDSTYLYWLNNKLILLDGQTKCNIYALNCLYRAGFRTPDVNALSRDLADTSKFTDILPIVGISEPDSAKKGDLIAWTGHVIIFDELVKIKNDIYARAWWAGTRQADNGENIINNVVYGKYKLSGFYVIRRPVKK